MRATRAATLLAALWVGAARGEDGVVEAPVADAGAAVDAGTPAELGNSSGESMAADGGTAADAGAAEDEDVYALTRDVMDVFFQKRGPQHKPEMKIGKPYMTVLPGISTSPSTGVLAAVTLQGVFLTGPKETTSVSQAQAVVAFTSMKQLFLALRSQIFLPGNRVALIGDWRVWDNVERTHGLGSQSPSEPLSRLEFGFVRFDETALINIKGHWFLGVGYRVDWFLNVKDPLREQTGASPLTEYGIGADGSLASGPSLAFMYDSRDTQVRPTRGLFVQAAIHGYPKQLGSSTGWLEGFAEFRGYHRPVANSSRQILAAWVFAWLTAGETPYLSLPASAWDTRGRSARGYAAGRFRGLAQLYAEAEYRLGITADGGIAAVAFFNLTTFTASRKTGFEAFMPGGGIGLRVLLAKEVGAYLAIDGAIGVESSGVYFMLGEAF